VVYNSRKFNGFNNCTLWCIIGAIKLGKCAHPTPSGVRERHTCIDLIKSKYENTIFTAEPQQRWTCVSWIPRSRIEENERTHGIINCFTKLGGDGYDDQNYSIYKHTGCYPWWSKLFHTSTHRLLPMMIKIIPYINTQVATHDDQNYSIYQHTGCYPWWSKLFHTSTHRLLPMMIKIIPYINTQVATHDDQNYSIHQHTGCYPRWSKLFNI
jgi:hypothetical protein